MEILKSWPRCRQVRSGPNGERPISAPEGADDRPGCRPRPGNRPRRSRAGGRGAAPLPAGLPAGDCIEAAAARRSWARKDRKELLGRRPQELLRWSERRSLDRPRPWPVRGRRRPVPGDALPTAAPGVEPGAAGRNG